MTIPLRPHAPRVAVECGCALGEEVTWDARSGTLTWVDIENPAIWRHVPETGETRRMALDEKISFALLTPDPERVVAGFKSGVARLDLTTGMREPLVAPHPHPAGNRLNSGQIGPDGALWFSTMDDAERGDTGAFHRWDGADLVTFGGMAAVTNGPALTADGNAAYTADTAGGIIRRHALLDGAIGGPETFATFEEGWGKPDGLTLDAEDHLWACHYGGGRITRFRPDGAVERVVEMPTSLVTKCAFGGPGLATLYVTTCLRGRDPAKHPMAGHLYAVDTDIRGWPADIFGCARGATA